MSLVMDLVKELLAFRRVRVNGADVPARAALEFDPPVNCRDDPDGDRAQLVFPFAPQLRVLDPSPGDHAIPEAPAVDYIDGAESNVEIVMPPAQLYGGQSIDVIDLGDVARSVTLRAATGELDLINGQGTQVTIPGVGLCVRLVAFSGSIDRRGGWYVVSSSERGS